MKRFYSEKMIHFESMTFRSVRRAIAPHIVVCIMLVIFSMANILIVSGIKSKGFYAAEAIGLSSPFLLLFLHLTYIVTMNISTIFRKIHRFDCQVIDETRSYIKTALLVALLYSFVLTAIYSVVVGYVYFSLKGPLQLHPEDILIKQRFDDGMHYCELTLPLIFCFSLTIFSIKLLMYYNKQKTVISLILFFVVSDLLLSSLLCYVTPATSFVHGVIGAAIGTLVAAIATFLIAAIVATLTVINFDPNVENKFNLYWLRETLYNSLFPTIIFICVSIAKTIALFAISFFRTITNDDSSLFSQVIVFNYLNLFCAFPRGIGMGLSYKLYGTWIGKKIFQSNLYKLTILLREFGIIYLFFNFFLLLTYPIFGHIICNNWNAGNRSGIYQNVEFWPTILNMLPSVILCLFFSTGVFISLVFSPFLNAISGKNIMFKWIISGLVIMAILIYAVGYVIMLKNSNNVDFLKKLNVAEIMTPMAMYGIYISIVTCVKVQRIKQNLWKI